MSQIYFSSPPYAVMPRDYLFARIQGIQGPIEVTEDLFFALLWCAIEEGDIETNNAEGVHGFKWKGYIIVKA